MKRSHTAMDGSGAGLRPASVLPQPLLLRGSAREIDQEAKSAAEMLMGLTTEEDSDMSQDLAMFDDPSGDFKKTFGKCGMGAGRVDQIVATIHCAVTQDIDTGAFEPHEIDWANIYAQSTHEDNSKLWKYFKVWFEQGKHGTTPHWHLWGQLTRKVQMGNRKKDHIANQITLNAKAQAKGGSSQHGCKHPWIDAAQGDREAMERYMQKEGDVPSCECGVYDPQQARQGKNANDNIFKMVDEGAGYLDIFRRFPDQASRMMKSLDRLITERDSALVRTERTKGIIYWGPTGTGKSRRAFGWDYNPKTCFVKSYSTADKSSWRWWCGFTPHIENVVLDELRNGVPFRDMLQMADNTPFGVEVKYGGRICFRPKMVIATMPMHPREVWEHSLGEQEGWDQFTRRWRIIRCYKEVDRNGDDIYLQQEEEGEPECYQNPYDLQFDCGPAHHKTGIDGAGCCFSISDVPEE